ncbi:hypothetical protein KJ603_00285 [Patescibacteria group bacterium]|nr:hypothetical protein [Patescibacteria group bacterium]
MKKISVLLIMLLVIFTSCVLVSNTKSEKIPGYLINNQLPVGWVDIPRYIMDDKPSLLGWIV